MLVKILNKESHKLSQKDKETYEHWIALQLRVISRFLDTKETEELEWVVEHTKCRACRVNVKTALVLWQEGYKNLAMRNLEFATEALKSMKQEVKEGM